MGGTGFAASYINLANNTNNDVFYPPAHTGQGNLNDLNTSLWSYSVASNSGTQSVNGITINIICKHLIQIFHLLEIIITLFV